ncbi:hypothetical protein ZIOFF_047077 [Zingiber officinale]|uniref:Elongator complex protein 4 n=1 Tax=Zingiber officinale TaxID=94328 RepID=A0A8J5FUC4_ZINOF|nr:hypothetical protein ZIOFF_047077 [Zingiber officinale]
MATAAGSPSCSPRTAAAAASSFSRTASSSMASHHVPSNPGVKIGPNGTAFVSSGIPDLDRILGGGFLLGSLVLVMEDADAPHHLLLLRNFMSQGVVLRQPVLFASPLGNPRAFLGTLPSPASPSKEQIKRTMAGGNDQQELEKGLRIAWQYKKYFGDQQSSSIHDRDAKQEFSNEFDLRKPLERRLVQYIETISLQDSTDIAVLRDRFSNFLSRLPRIYLTWSDGDNLRAGRIAIQSFCAPQCGFSERDWDMVAFIRYAALYEDKDLAKLLTGYQDMLGLLHVHKVAQMNTQVPTVLETSTFALKLLKRRSLVLERLNQAPVETSSGTSYSSSGSCIGSSHASLDF